MRTKEQIEDELAKEFTRFNVKKLKTGPKQAKVQILADMILVRLKGDLQLPSASHHYFAIINTCPLSNLKH